jgi:hypothetical protein
VIFIHPQLNAQLDASTLDGVHAALQAAIRLEHATIPPYLYALYSLDQDRNIAAAAILRSVVDEEMAHLTMAANILNALGGHPAMDRPSLLPRYPGPLPGTVEHGLAVGLAPFSIGLVRDTFMAIEEPEHPLDFAVPPAAGITRDPGRAPGGDSVQPLTIGQFYRRIRDAVTALGDGAFTGPPRLQVTTDLLPGIIAVTSVDTACQAIDTIIDQGEGTDKSPEEADGPDVAHYYRFAEVVYGHRLVPAPSAPPGAPVEQRYWYGGAPVPFDPAAVYAAPVNPASVAYRAGSPVRRRACTNFNYTYTNLLKSLHVTCNGEPDRLLPAIGIMMSLQEQAMGMMTGITTGGVPTGPTFEWQPVNTMIPA